MEHKAYRLAEIAARFGGRLLGDGNTAVHQIATLESAAAGHITFLANSKYRSQLAATNASAVILGEADAEATALPRIVSDNPYACFAKVSALLNPPQRFNPGVHPAAVVGEGVEIGENAHVAACAVIGANAKIGAGSVIMEGASIGENVRIGADARIYPNVVIYRDCALGDRVIAHSGAIIGADGFGLAPENGRWLKIPQIGRVVIGDDVEIGANTTVDRGALDDTVIEEGVKLDNQIQVAHNVRIGAHTAIAGCVGIAGSTTIGRHCRIGGSAGILGHLKIADNVEISAFTLVNKSIRESGSYTGIYPFGKTGEWSRNAVHLRRLDELADRIKRLEQEIEALRRTEQ
jgi:UDP-3-O-[3-hydroxymyristoyl] glucosamine N-acyltransferase